MRIDKSKKENCNKNKIFKSNIISDFSSSLDIRSARYKDADQSENSQNIKKSLNKLKNLKMNSKMINSNEFLNMKFKDVVKIVQKYMSNTFIETLRKKKSDINNISVNIDLNNTF